MRMALYNGYEFPELPTTFLTSMPWHFILKRDGKYIFLAINAVIEYSSTSYDHGFVDNIIYWYNGGYAKYELSEDGTLWRLIGSVSPGQRGTFCATDLVWSRYDLRTPCGALVFKGSAPKLIGDPCNEDAEYKLQGGLLTEIANVIRNKTRSSTLLTVRQMIDKVKNPIVDMFLNVSYGHTPPADSNMFWIKTDKPERVQLYRDHLYTKTRRSLFSTKNGTRYIYKTTCVWTDENIMYMFGGKGAGSGKTFYAPIFKYDMSTGTQTNTGVTYPKKDADNIIGVCVGTYVYLLGGDPYEREGSNDIYRFDTNNNTLELVEFKLPVKVGLHTTSAFVYDSRIYMYGGYDDTGKYMSYIYVYDTDAGTITTIDPEYTCEGYAVRGCGLSVVQNKIYLFGGDYVNDDGVRQYIPHVCIYDPDTNVLDKLNCTLPVGISLLKAYVMGDKIYLFGGSNAKTYSPPLSLSMTTCNYVLSYDVKSSFIEELPPFAIRNRHRLTDVKIIGNTAFIATTSCYSDPYKHRAYTYDIACAKSDVTIAMSDADALPNIFNRCVGELGMGITGVYKHTGFGSIEPVPVLAYRDGAWIEICKLLDSHIGMQVSAVPATCTEPGTTSGVKCMLCDTIISGVEEIPALGHSYDDGVEVDGVITYTCTVCGATKQ